MLTNPIGIEVYNLDGQMTDDLPAQYNSGLAVNRTLLQVILDDASAAADLFRIFRGDKVEPRREFIEKHALERGNLDV